MPQSAALGPATREIRMTQALNQSQDRALQLQREHDEMLHRSVQSEAEVVRLTMIMERSEAENRALVEEKQHILRDLQSVRREHREALDQLATLKSEAHKSRTASEEYRDRFEQIVGEQRKQIEALEEAGGRTSHELAEQNRYVADFGASLYTCLGERSELLKFVVDLLTALQALFYNPTPFLAERIAPGEPRRPRSADVSHRRCESCPRSPGVVGVRSAAFGRGQHAQHRQEWREGLSDVKALIRALEGEIADASRELTSQVQRVVREAEAAAQGLLPARGGESRPVVAPGASGDLGQALRVCTRWIEQEQRRRSKQGLERHDLAPRLCWDEERLRYQEVSRVMESKFAQLAKLQRVLATRQGAVARRTS